MYIQLYRHDSLIFSKSSDITLFIGQIIYNVGIFFPKGANRSYHICFVTIHSRWTTTASWTDASHLKQPRLVNNPGYSNMALNFYLR